jgi:GH18 family chitinase
MKIIGYYNSFERQDVLSKLNLSVLTHLNYAFLLPREDGMVYFRNEEDVRRVVSIAKSHGIKVFVSVGGWCDEDIILNNVFEAICNDQKRVDSFIENVIRIVEKYSFDGIDIDWEYPKLPYAKALFYLVDTLKEYTDSKGKALTMAIYHSVYGERKFDRICAITDDVVSRLDWLNVMTYDCHEEPNHSSRELAQKCIAYWNSTRGIGKERIMIGIPFYSKPSQRRYCDLVLEDYRNAFKDFIGGDSLNSIYTVREKTYMARFCCGGLIIWAINYDTLEDKYSLLRAIGTAKGE